MNTFLQEHKFVWCSLVSALVRTLPSNLSWLFQNNQHDDEIHRLQLQGILKQRTAMLMPSLIQTKQLIAIVDTSPETRHQPALHL